MRGVSRRSKCPRCRRNTPIRRKDLLPAIGGSIRSFSSFPSFFVESVFDEHYTDVAERVVGLALEHVVERGHPGVSVPQAFAGSVLVPGVAGESFVDMAWHEL